ALVITEGVIPYLSNDEAAQLARDLRSVPSFQNWFQDYRRTGPPMKSPEKLKPRRKRAPFPFDNKNPLAFFAELGWQVLDNTLAIDEGRRLGRPFPIPFPFNFIVRFMSETRQREARESMGYVLLRAG